MKMTVNLSANDIEQLVKEHLEQKFDKVKSVEIKVDKELRGTQMDEYYVTVFKGVNCEVEV